MVKSILTNDMEHCFRCGAPKECIHHIFPGTAKRKISDKNGFIVPLCNYCHNMSDNSVHFNKQLDLVIRRLCQLKYEAMGHSREDFIKLIGRNYCD